MIQRIQTIWLLLASVAAFLTLKFSFYIGNITDANNVKTMHLLNARFNILLLIVTIAIGVIALATIFLYTDRKKQILFTVVNLILSALLILLYFWQKQKFTDGAITLTSIFSFAIPILLFLALQAIQKDERLVKSVDRLR